MNNTQLSRDETIQIILEASRAMQKNHVKQVRDLDAEIGDGDLGITIQKGFKAVEDLLAVPGDTPLDQLLKDVGMEFSEANPSTFSSFFATSFRKAGVSLKGKTQIDVHDLSDMFQAAVQGIMKLGKAEVGDKTILDALVPAAESIKKAADQEMQIFDALKQAEEAANEGVKSTIDMVSKMGRARSFGERTRGVQDPGATAVYLFIHELSMAVSNLFNKKSLEG
jgi:dihydroxyacetone kinase-like protein